MSHYINKDASNEAPLTALTRTPPMSAKEHAVLMQKRTQQRRQAEAQREAKAEAEAEKNCW